MNTETATLLSALLAEVTLLRQFKPVKGMASEALRRRRMTRGAYAQFKNAAVEEVLNRRTYK